MSNKDYRDYQKSITYKSSSIHSNIPHRKKSGLPSYLWTMQLILVILAVLYIGLLYLFGYSVITPVLGIIAIIAGGLTAFLNLGNRSLPLFAIDTVLTIALIIHLVNLMA